MISQRKNSAPILALFLAVSVWPLVWLGLYVWQSAPLAFAFYHLLCLVGGFVLRSQVPRDETDPPGPHWRRIVLLAVLTANVSAFALYKLLGASLFDTAQTLSLMEGRGLPPSSYLWLFPYFALVNPILEEWFWRGGVYRTLRESWGDGRRLHATIVASLLFGGWHFLTVQLFVSPIVAIGATLLIAAVGFALTTVYDRTQRLVYPVLLHALGGDVPLLLLLLLIRHS